MALMVDRFNIKIVYVPYTNRQKSQIGEFWEPVSLGEK